MGGITYAIFDPIRSFFVESKLKNTFSLDDYKLYSWLKDKTVGLFIDEKSKDEEDDWWERKEAASNIKELLRETPSTFIQISGPRGSGKHQLLSKSIHKDSKHLNINCEFIANNSKTDSALVGSLANETGYWPIFSWVNSISNLIDLAAVGLIGSKAGFATPVDAQLRQILNVTTGALVSVKQKEIEKREKEAKKLGRQGKSKGVNPKGDGKSHETGDSKRDSVGNSGAAAELGHGDPESQREKENDPLIPEEIVKQDLNLKKKDERVGTAPVVSSRFSISKVSLNR